MYYFNNNAKSKNGNMCKSSHKSDCASLYSFSSQKLLDDRLKRSLEIFEKNHTKPDSEGTECSGTKCVRRSRYKPTAQPLPINFPVRYANDQTHAFQYSQNSQSSTYSISSINHHISTERINSANNNTNYSYNNCTNVNSTKKLYNTIFIELKTRIEGE